MSSWVPLAMSEEQRGFQPMRRGRWEGDRRRQEKPGRDRQQWEAGGIGPVGTLGALAFSEREGEP